MGYYFAQVEKQDLAHGKEPLQLSQTQMAEGEKAKHYLQYQPAHQINQGERQMPGNQIRIIGLGEAIRAF